MNQQLTDRAGGPVGPGRMELPSIDRIRMIAFDLDGTLLTEEKRLTPATREILTRAAARGIVLLTTTGRSLSGIPDAVKALPGAYYALTSNGAGVYRRVDAPPLENPINSTPVECEIPGWTLSAEAEQGRPTFELDVQTGYELLFERLMDVPRGIALMRELGKLSVMPDPFIDGACYMRADKAFLIDRMDVSDAMKAYIRSSRTMVPDMDRFLSDKKMQKITINFVCDENHDRIDLAPVLEVLKKFPEFVAVTGGIRNIEVSDRLATKGDSMLALAERIGIRPEEILAFGDSENDITMLRAAGTGVAMANSLDITCEAADIVAGSNDEDGVAALLRALPGW